MFGSHETTMSKRSAGTNHGEALVWVVDAGGVGGEDFNRVDYEQRRVSARGGRILHVEHTSWTMVREYPPMRLILPEALKTL